jgi:hypothetical protein
MATARNQKYQGKDYCTPQQIAAWKLSYGGCDRPTVIPIQPLIQAGSLVATA